MLAILLGFGFHYCCKCSVGLELSWASSVEWNWKPPGWKLELHNHRINLYLVEVTTFQDDQSNGEFHSDWSEIWGVSGMWGGEWYEQIRFQNGVICRCGVLRFALSRRKQHRNGCSGVEDEPERGKIDRSMTSEGVREEVSSWTTLGKCRFQRQEEKKMAKVKIGFWEVTRA